MNNLDALAQLFADHRKCGVYSAIDAPVDIDGAAGRARLALRRIDAAGVTTKAQLLRLFAQGLAFPDWFGRNWDALADCITDLSWIEERGLVVLLEGVDAYIDADPAGFAILLDILGSAADYWREEGAPFWVVFSGPAAAGLGLPALHA